MDDFYARLERRQPGAAGAVLAGLVAAAVAVGLRVAIGPDIGREQIIFSYPAIIAATMLFGAWAGTVAAAVCLGLAWYLVIPVRDSFVLEDVDAAITLAIYLVVAVALVAAIAAMRTAVLRYRTLARWLDTEVETRTAERNRIWSRSLEAVVIIEADGRIRSANPAFHRLAGTEPASLAGTDFELRFVERDRATVRDALTALGLGTDGHVGFEAHLPAMGGRLAIAWSAVRDEGSVYLVGRDVTFERACSEQLLQSQRMDVVGQMTGGLAHDFANLLNPITMGLELVRQRHGGDATTAGVLDTADEAAELARLLVRRLLAFSRAEPAAMEDVDLGDQLLRAVPLLRQALGTHRLDARIADDLGRARLGTDELEVALLNLALNARDASPPGSGVTLTAVRAGGGVEIALGDRGQGMTAEARERATDPFFTTKRGGSGSGLGLTMVQGFVDRAGGEMAIEPRDGGGTRVVLRLPTLD